jgi:hypothetical protein
VLTTMLLLGSSANPLVGVSIGLSQDCRGCAVLAIIPGAGPTGGLIFKTTHYASRLQNAGVSVARAEAAVAREVEAMRPHMAGWAVGRIRVDNVLVEYRVDVMRNGNLNIGSIFPVR